MSTEIKEKEKGCKEGNEPAQIYEKASILEAKHIVRLRKYRLNLEATIQHVLRFNLG